MLGFFCFMMFQVYILQSTVNGGFYIGQTNDFERRYSDHNKGFSKSTSRYAPWNLVWITSLDDRKSAFKLEQELKSLKSRLRIIKYITENPCVPGSENLQIFDLVDFRESS
jgi:putative endonuclease